MLMDIVNQKSQLVINITSQFYFVFVMDNSPLSPLPSPLRRKGLSKKFSKILKQQEHAVVDKDIQPGKVDIQSSDRCRVRVVNFFGDVSTEIFCLHTSYDEQYVAAGCENGDVRVYHIFQGKLLLMSNSSRMQGYPNTGIRWRPKSSKQFTACNSDGTIKWYDRQTEQMIAYHEGEVGYLCTDYNFDGSWSVYGNEKYEIEIFDSDTKKKTLRYDAGAVQNWNPNHTNRIFCVKGIKKEPSLFFSGGWDSTVRLWDVRVPNQFVRKFYGPSISSDSLDLKGNTLLVGNYSNTDVVQLYDFGQGKLIQTLDLKQKQKNFYCLSAAYAHKSKFDLFAVGLTHANKIKIFEGNQVIGTIHFQSSPLALNFYQFNQKDFMVAGGAQGTIYVIKVKIVQQNK